MAKLRLNIPARDNSERLRCAASGASVWNRRAYGQRVGLTLIELLITISIIATLSAIFVGASRSAMEAANAARTKSTISKLHSLLMEKWASYSTRRADINPDILNMINQKANSGAFTPRQKGLALADVRLLATRELMKLEIPDRWSDITLRSIPDSISSNYTVGNPEILNIRPSISSTYLQRFSQLLSNTNNGKLLRQNQGAECLYLTIMLTTGDGEARTLFSPQDIGDTDGDGALEFLDGWGNPIQFIRWPAGFVSDIQPLDPDVEPPNNRFADLYPDPFDHFLRDRFENIPKTSPLASPNWRDYRNGIIDITELVRTLRDLTAAYRLTPLIYSGGSDGDTDFVGDVGAVVGLDPYASIYSKNGNLQLGTPFDDELEGDNNWNDNIHNHLLDN